MTFCDNFCLKKVIRSMKTFTNINGINRRISKNIYIFSVFVCNNPTNRFCAIQCNTFKCWGASGVCLINILMFIRTIAKKYINIISNKEPIFEYHKKIISAGA